MGGAYIWPRLCEVLEYRNKVKQVVANVIDNGSIETPITQQSPWVCYVNQKYLCMFIAYMYVVVTTNGNRT